jgi:hypothetical protein
MQTQQKLFIKKSSVSKLANNNNSNLTITIPMLTITIP